MRLVVLSLHHASKVGFLDSTAVSCKLFTVLPCADFAICLRYPALQLQQSTMTQKYFCQVIKPDETTLFSERNYLNLTLSFFAVTWPR